MELRDDREASEPLGDAWRSYSRASIGPSGGAATVSVRGAASRTDTDWPPRSPFANASSSSKLSAVSRLKRAIGAVRQNDWHAFCLRVGPPAASQGINKTISAVA